MVQSLCSIAAAVSGVILVVMMLLRAPGFPQRARGAVLAAALGLFVTAKYAALVTAPFDLLFASGVGIYLTIFAFQQFRTYPRTTI